MNKEQIPWKVTNQSKELEHNIDIQGKHEVVLI